MLVRSSPPVTSRTVRLIGVKAVKLSPSVKADRVLGRRTKSRHYPSIVGAVAEAVDVAVPPPVEPAVLPGTPKEFPIKESVLIEKAQRLFKDGLHKSPDELADDFRFEFPVVSLAKDEYVKAVSSFGLEQAFPNLQSNAYDWRVDKYEPNRVWFTIRTAATHTGELNFGGTKYPPSGKLILMAPECMSLTFNEEGKVTSITGGYIMDRRVGNGGGYGAMFGVLTALGVKIPPPGSLTFKLLNWFAALQRKLKGS